MTTSHAIDREVLRKRADALEIVDLRKELTAYEVLWTRHTSVKKMADLFTKHGNILPTAVSAKERVTPAEMETMNANLQRFMPPSQYSAVLYKDFEYPTRLRDAKHPVEALYYQGALDLLASRSVSVIGARRASADGIARAKRIAKLLVRNKFTVMSGLAEGIDTAAHTAAIEGGGQTIAVIGTPLNEVYPKANNSLQNFIASRYLLVSQVPFYFASKAHINIKRLFFLERNKTMSALSLATVIVEASDKSGSLTQANAAALQGRKLFILNSCFRKELRWPWKFLEMGAVRVVDGEEILSALAV